MVAVGREKETDFWLPAAVSWMLGRLPLDEDVRLDREADKRVLLDAISEAVV